MVVVVVLMRLVMASSPLTHPVITVWSLRSAILVGMMVGCQAPNTHSGWMFLGDRRENQAGLEGVTLGSAFIRTFHQEFTVLQQEELPDF